MVGILTSAELTDHRIHELEKLTERLERSLELLHDRLDERLATVAPVADLVTLQAELAALSAHALKAQGAAEMKRAMWIQWRRITGATLGGLMLLAAIAQAVAALT